MARLVPRWLGDRSIQTRWMLVFAGILLLITAEGATNFYIFDLEQSDRTLITHTYDVLLEISQAELGLIGQQSSLRGMTLTGAIHAQEDFQQAASMFNDAFEQVTTLTRDNPKQQAKIAEIRVAVNAWRLDFVQPMLLAVQANNRPNTLEIINEAARVGRVRGIFSELRAMKTIELELLTQRRYSLENLVSLIKQVNTGFLLVWLLFIGAVVRLSAALVSRPIQALADIITRLANHDYDVEVKWQKRGDEIGAIARALTVLTARSKEADHQAALLRASGESMRVQARQLAQSNEELKQKTSALDEKNQQLEVLQRETQEKAQQLERVGRYRADFVASTSHELRTPLNSMLILSKILADNVGGRLNAEDEESARTIHESGTGLLRLINDILDLSKMEAGKIRITLEDVLLEECIARWRRSFAAQAKQRKLRFAVEASFDAPPKLHTDGGRLDQIVNNLVSNAFKFTEHGEIRVYLLRPPSSTVFKRADLKLGETIVIRVSDTGIGIAEDQYARVFQAFEQVDIGGQRSYGGTGLGLAITRSIVELMGGEIHLESQPGKGSIFSVYLPIFLASVQVDAAALPSVTAPITQLEMPKFSAPATPAAPAVPIPSFDLAKPTRLPSRFRREMITEVPVIELPSMAQTPTSPSAASSPTVASSPKVELLLVGRNLLIVDDNMRESFLLAKKLRERGLKVSLAPTADKALASSNTGTFDWCLVDVDSRSLNGKEVLRRMRENEAWKQTRLIAAGSSMQAADRRECRAAGADDIIVKPLELESFLTDLQAGLGQRGVAGASSGPSLAS